MFLDFFFPSLWMRVVFQAGSLGKDHWENVVIFFSPSSIEQPSASLLLFPFPWWPSSPPQASTLVLLESTLRMLGLCAHCVTGGPKPECLQPSPGAWMPRLPSSQTPILESCTIHPSCPGYSATSSCRSCFISAPTATSCSDGLATTDSVFHWPVPPPQN